MTNENEVFIFDIAGLHFVFSKDIGLIVFYCCVMMSL